MAQLAARGSKPPAKPRAALLAGLLLVELLLAHASPASLAQLPPALPRPQVGETEPVFTPPANTATRQLVADVQILGNSATKEFEIQKHIQTRKEREFDPELVQSDVRRLVQTGLFKDVQTFTRNVPGGVVVIYEVFERPRIGKIIHIGNRGYSDKKLRKEHGLKEGDSINSYTSEEARRKIEELYRKGGFPNASVSLVEGDKPGDKNVVFLINEGQLERISKVVFEGNQVAIDGRLKTQIQSKPGYFWYFFGGKVDRSKIDADVERLTAYYRSLGYFRARVGRELVFDEDGKWLTLKFIIDEGPRYVVRNVSIEGNVKFASAPLLDFLKLQSGKYFNQAEMNADITTITDLYGSQGHVFADVQADPRFLEEPGQLDLIYRVKEGDVFSVGKINVHIGGEFPHTRETVVLNRAGNLRPGDTIDARALRDWERRLKASQLFETNPANGEPPRVVVKPPDLAALDGLAQNTRPTGTVRGQSPDETEATRSQHTAYARATATPYQSSLAPASSPRLPPALPQPYRTPYTAN